MVLLTPRLMCAAKLAAGAQKIIDVGCDHGYLSSYMVTDGGARFAYACDINNGPLERAKETIKKLGIEEKVSLRLCNGLEGFEGNEADTVFICGMGGELIADILATAPWTLKNDTALILQPMSRSEKLRVFLDKNGYGIKREVIVKEGRHLYCVLKAAHGGADAGCGNYYLFSNNIDRNAFFEEYIKSLLFKYRSIALSKERAGIPNNKEKEMIKFLEEYHAY